MKKRLIIAAVVIALLAGIAVLLFLLPDEAEQPEVSPSGTVSLEPSSTKYLINEMFTELEYIRVYDAEGTLVNTVLAGDDGSFSVSPQREGWSYDEAAIRAAAVNAATLSSLSTVAESPDDLSQYGLDAPTWKVEIGFVGGNDYKLEVGSPTALNNSYYCSVGDGNVYAVGAYSISQITRREMEYRTYRFFPDYYDTDTMSYNTNGEITYVRVVDPATGFDMAVRAADESEMGRTSSTIYMESPFEGLCNDERVENSLINPAVAITVDSVYLDDPTDEELTEYGFDSPREVWLKNTSGDEVHYYIGRTVGANGYVMVEGFDTILTATNISDALFQVNYVDLLFKMLVTEAVRDVQKVEFFVPEGEHTLELRFEETEDGSGQVYGTLDGEAMSSANASRLYGYLLAVQVYEAYDRDAVEVTGSPAYRFVVTGNDGSVVTLELYELNSRRYAAFLNGEETGFAVHRDDLRNISAAFDTIREGGELERPN